MHSAAADRFLDRAEQALLGSPGGRCESETAFLQRLLHELGSDVSHPGLSPALLLPPCCGPDPLKLSVQAQAGIKLFMATP